MNDYKELIDNLKYLSDTVRYPIVNELHAGSLMADAADVIEQLIKERNAAVADLTDLNKRYGSYCKYCKGSKCGVPTRDGWCAACPKWEWRGVQEVEIEEGCGKMKRIEIYTDGACSGNPGPGGWGAILLYNGEEMELSGSEKYTTNNRMELTAVISALERVKEPCEIDLYSDSKYVIDALEKGWARSWREKGWVKSDKKPALNPDLWEELLLLTMQHKMHYHWVKGHAGNKYNNRCDALAVMERDRS